MNEADLELLVNDALEKGLRSEAGRRADGPIRQPQMDCMSSSWRNSAFRIAIRERYAQGRT